LIILITCLNQFDVLLSISAIRSGEEEEETVEGKNIRIKNIGVLLLHEKDISLK
jgi:hypothetical protein